MKNLLKKITSGKLFAASFIITMVLTYLCTGEFSLKHTLYPFAMSLTLAFGFSIFNNDHDSNSGKAWLCSSVFLLLIAASSFIIHYVSPAQPLRIWEVNAGIGFFASAAFLLVLICGSIPASFSKIRTLAGSVTFIIYTLPFFMLWCYFFASHAWLHVDAVFAIMQTDPVEALSYIRDTLGITTSILALVVYLGLIVLFLRLLRHLHKPSLQKKASGLLIFLFLLNIFLVWRTRENIYTEPYLQVNKYASLLQAFHENQKKREAMIQDNLNIRSSGFDGVYVMIIGEATTRNHMGAFGYQRDTTPWLSSMKDQPGTILFPNTWSNATFTVLSLSYGLTSKNQYNDVSLDSAPSIIEVVKAAGYNTAWCSNQIRFYGVYDTPIAVIANEADQKDWDNTNPLGENFFDEVLLDSIDQLKIQNKMLIVLHLMGSHNSYHSRYPKEFQIYNEEEHHIGDYDNSILYNDHFMKQVYEKVSAMPNFKALVYFSDHGESVDANGMHDSANFRWSMARIPLYMMFSESYRQEHPDIYNNLQNARNNYYTNDLMFNTMLGIMGIQIPNIYEPENDITSTTYNNDVNRFMTIHGKRAIKEDVDP